MVMNENFTYFFEELGPPNLVQQPSKTDLEKYRGKVPDSLIDFWTEAGWSGYAGGLFWSTDPDEFSPAIDAWLDGNSSVKKDVFTVIGRSAFGDLFLWGKNTGVSVTINPLVSTIITAEPDRNVVEGAPDLALISFFATLDRDYLDFEDIKEKHLFDRALKKLGPLKNDEMYAFEPALALGGAPKIENLSKLKIIEHLVLLSQIAEIKYLHMDITGHV
jgi:hypothetical protein